MRLQADVEEAAALERREPLVNGSDDDDQMCVCALQNGAAAQMLGTFLALEKAAELAGQGLLRRISQAEFGQLPEGTRLHSQCECDEKEEGEKTEEEAKGDDGEEPNVACPLCNAACDMINPRQSRGLTFRRLLFRSRRSKRHARGMAHLLRRRASAFCLLRQKDTARMRMRLQAHACSMPAAQPDLRCIELAAIRRARFSPQPLSFRCRRSARHV